jgi:hypothetical protein
MACVLQHPAQNDNVLFDFSISTTGNAKTLAHARSNKIDYEFRSLTYSKDITVTDLLQQTSSSAADLFLESVQFSFQQMKTPFFSFLLLINKEVTMSLFA